MNIEKILIPKTNEKHRSGTKMKPRYITIHETNAESKHADAFAHARSQARENNNLDYSWHYTVDDSDIVYQSIPDDEISIQVSDILSPCNMSSIGVMICVNSGGIFRRARYNAIQLIILLMKRHRLPLGSIYPHYKWDHACCPAKIMKIGWHHFIGELKYELDLARKKL